MAAVPMLLRNVKLEMPETEICRALSCQLHIPNNFTFGQSKKAIGQESPIGPCIATLWWTIVRLVVSDHDGRRHNSEMEPQEKTASPHQRRRTTTSGPEEDHSRSRRSNGWAECREKNIGIGPMESTFLLTFLLIGSLRTNREYFRVVGRAATSPNARE